MKHDRARSRRTATSRPPRPKLAATWMVLCCLALPGQAAESDRPGERASPTVADLVAACDRGSAQGGRGVDAALCEWYAAPCACRPDYRDPGVAWCIPEREPIEATVAKVLAELRRVPDAREPAKAAVAQALRRLYPCPAGR